MDIVFPSVGPNAVSSASLIAATAPVNQALATPQVAPVSVEAAASVDLSPLAQFLSTAGLSRKTLQALQGAPTDPANNQAQAAEFANLAATAQNLVQAFNNLQTNSIDTVPLTLDVLSDQSPAAQFAQALQSQQAEPDAVNDPTLNLANLPQIGLNFQASPVIDQNDSANLNLSVDLTTLQSAFSADRAGTLTLLEQTADALGQLGNGLADQISSASTELDATAAAQAEAQRAADLQTREQQEAVAQDAARLQDQTVSRRTLAGMELNDLLANQQIDDAEQANRVQQNLTQTAEIARTQQANQADLLAQTSDLASTADAAQARAANEFAQTVRDNVAEAAADAARTVTENQAAQTVQATQDQARADAARVTDQAQQENVTQALAQQANLDATRQAEQLNQLTRRQDSIEQTRLEDSRLDQSRIDAARTADQSTQAYSTQAALDGSRLATANQAAQTVQNNAQQATADAARLDADYALQTRLANAAAETARLNTANLVDNATQASAVNTAAETARAQAVQTERNLETAALDVRRQTAQAVQEVQLREADDTRLANARALERQRTLDEANLVLNPAQASPLSETEAARLGTTSENGNNALENTAAAEQTRQTIADLAAQEQARVDAQVAQSQAQAAADAAEQARLVPPPVNLADQNHARVLAQDAATAAAIAAYHLTDGPFKASAEGQNRLAQKNGIPPVEAVVKVDPVEKI